MHKARFQTEKIARDFLEKTLTLAPASLEVVPNKNYTAWCWIVFWLDN